MNTDAHTKGKRNRPKSRQGADLLTGLREGRIPRSSQLWQLQHRRSFCDAFYFDVSTAKPDAGDVFHAVFSCLPKWAIALMRLRNWIACRLGFETGPIAMTPPRESMYPGAQAGFLTLTSVSDDEVVAYAAEPHMALWISVCRQSCGRFAVVTYVHLRTLRSRVYMTAIMPFHKIIARRTIKRALRLGLL